MYKTEERLKLFAMSVQLLENELGRVEKNLSIDLGRAHQSILQQDALYYPQIDEEIRRTASKMARHYEVFYSLEKSIRNLISETLEASNGENWWDSGRIPAIVKKNAEDLRKKEIDTGTTPRSSEPIDYTTFGELGEIIKTNWDVFGSIFSSPKAVERVMANLNTLRGPIAHCSVLADDEILRLRLSVRDWFRLME